MDRNQNNRKCKHCGKRFHAPPSAPRPFCSRVCSDKGRKKSESKLKVTKPCERCGKKFTSFASRSAKYCSKKCYAEPKSRVIKPCKHCGKSFESYAYRETNYCSKACGNAGRRADTIKRNAEKARIKAEMRASAPARRVTKKCKHCGTPFTSYAKDNQKCCSRECSDVLRKPPAKICVARGKVFHRSQSQGESPYCSMPCYLQHQSRKVEKSCIGCGSKFIVPKSKSDRLYCSMECKLARRKTPATGTCEHCGSEFARKSNASKMFCTRKCSHASRSARMTINCARCGRQYETSFHQITKRGGKFCSTECRDNKPYNTKRAYARRGTWAHISKRIIERDNHTCAVCGCDCKGKKQMACVHHVIPAIKFGLTHAQLANRDENLITVCRKCHGKVDRTRNDKKHEYAKLLYGKLAEKLGERAVSSYKEEADALLATAPQS